MITPSCCWIIRTMFQARVLRWPVTLSHSELPHSPHWLAPLHAGFCKLLIRGSENTPTPAMWQPAALKAKAQGMRQQLQHNPRTLTSENPCDKGTSGKSASRPENATTGHWKTTNTNLPASQTPKERRDQDQHEHEHEHEHEPAVCLPPRRYCCPWCWACPAHATGFGGVVPTVAHHRQAACRQVPGRAATRRPGGGGCRCAPSPWLVSGGRRLERMPMDRPG